MGSDAERYRSDPEYRARKRRAAAASYARQSPEERRAKRQDWKVRNPERRKAMDQRERDKLRHDVLTGYGGSCVCCGCEYEPHLTLDHTNGGGCAERRTEPGSKLFRRLRREGFPPGHQVLCWNCNWAKHKLGRCGCQDLVH